MENLQATCPSGHAVGKTYYAPLGHAPRKPAWGLSGWSWGGAWGGPRGRSLLARGIFWLRGKRLDKAVLART